MIARARIPIALLCCSRRYFCPTPLRFSSPLNVLTHSLSPSSLPEQLFPLRQLLLCIYSLNLPYMFFLPPFLQFASSLFSPLLCCGGCVVSLGFLAGGRVSSSSPLSLPHPVWQWEKDDTTFAVIGRVVIIECSLLK